MTGRRAFLGMIGAFVLSFGLLIGSVAAGNMLLKTRANKLMELKLENRVLDEQQVALTQANKDIQKYAELEKIAKSIVPQDKNQAQTVLEIVSIAKEAGVPISTILFPTSTLGQTSTPSSSGTSSSTNSSANNTSTTPAAPKTSVTQVTPVSGMTGVYQMEITVQSDTNQPVRYSALIDFLSKLENNRRTAQVSNLTITPSQKDVTRITFTLGINVFIKP